MKPEEIKEGIEFIKARIKESLFPEEKEVLNAGLKILGFNLTSFLKQQLALINIEEGDSDELPEVNFLNLTQNRSMKRLMLREPTNKELEVLERFGAVQFSLLFIIYEWFLCEMGKDVAIQYAKYSLRLVNKMKLRFGNECPEYIEKFVENLNKEVGFVQSQLNSQTTIESAERIEKILHYMEINHPSKTSRPMIQTTVHPIHFEDFSGKQFERLVFAYVVRKKTWDSSPEWLGETGSDGGRDVWAVHKKETYCYACANHQQTGFKKGKDDIDSLKRNKFIPNNLRVIFGGAVSAAVRKKIKDYATKAGITNTEVWSGVELEEKLRKETPTLIQRFVEGEAFPDSPTEIIKYRNSVTPASDTEIINLLAECFDRPAFTTPFYLESSIPQFNLAIERTIEVLNTGVHRLNDGTIIREIPNRHAIQDPRLKQELESITQDVIKLRDNFTELLKQGEINQCGCGNPDCPTYMLSDKACIIMDQSRALIIERFRKLIPSFQVVISR